MKTIVAEPAVQEDLASVRAILITAELPVEGVEDQFPKAFAVVRDGPIVVAVAAVERYGDFGLLRSVAVRKQDRGRQLGSLLVRERLRIAELERATAVYLLTTASPEFFGRFGFVTTSRAEVPRDLALSLEFASICPSTAICLVKRFEPSTEVEEPKERTP